jgi:branched-chain amino acid aminotransferase
MKAFKNKDGDICIFRPQKHSERLNKSLTRMCMPTIPEEMFLQSLHSLIEFDQDWIPTSEGSSLYIRPVVFATESRFGVKISDQYVYVLMTSPVGPYFSKPVRIKIEESYVRASEGGAGFAKCAGNYGGAFYPTQVARQQGFDQILWTDAKEHKYIDEAGVMNAMFVIDGVLVTPALSTSILDGVTRDTIISLAPSLGVKVEQRRISVEEVLNGITSGKLTEAFGAGTAAVVSPIASVSFKDKEFHLPPVAPDSFQLRVKAKLNNIRMGIEEDTFNWNYLIKK